MQLLRNYYERDLLEEDLPAGGEPRDGRRADRLDPAALLLLLARLVSADRDRHQRPEGVRVPYQRSLTWS